MSKLNVLFPIETINRELDYRLVLALMCVNPDNRIFIGQHDVVHSAALQMKNGIYMGKNIFPNEFPWENLARYTAMKERGFSLIHLDEEGGIFGGGPPEWERALKARVDVSCLHEDDFMCTWGNFQRDVYKSGNPKCIDQIFATGHPKFDMYKGDLRQYFDADVLAIKKRFSPFVLINTNLAFANPGPGITYTFAEHWGWDVKDPAKRLRHMAEYGNVLRIMHGFLSLVNRLSLEFPALNFVIRPHPSEDLDFYSKIFAGIPNIHSVHEGSVGPWLMASEAMIHDGCTTGVEAYLADTKVITYKSINHPSFDLYLPNVLAPRCTTEDEVLTLLRQLLQTKAIPKVDDIPLKARDLLANLEGDAFAGVQRVFETCQERVRSRSSSFDESAFVVRDRVRATKQIAKDAVRPLIPPRYLPKTSQIKWLRTFRQMFYGFREADVRRRLANAERLVGKRARLRFYSRDLFTLEQA